MSFHVPEQYRVSTGELATDFTAGKNGAFILPPIIGNRNLAIIAADGSSWEVEGLPLPVWEHVSVHAFVGKNQFTPTWYEMCRVKDIFWDKADVVVQFHPAENNYVNIHQHTLHMWRPIGIELPLPPLVTV